MKIITRTPATCGEYIQGIWRNEPCLVSAPINLFSKVTIEDGTGKINLKAKGQKLLTDFFYQYSIPFDYLNKININIESEIPISNGFGSSTADLAGLLKGLGEYFYVDLTSKEIAKTLVKVDPTDNIMFETLNLFNHYTGEVLYNFKSFIFGEVLVFANINESVDTLNFGYLREFKRSSTTFKKIIDTFSEGCRTQDLSLIGAASTESALLNEVCLKKPFINDIIDLTYENNGYGIIIGHTGNLIGIIKDSLFNEDNFIQSLASFDEFKNNIMYNFDLIQGGIQVERIFEES